MWLGQAVASVEEEPAWVAKPLLLAREAAGLVSLLAAELNASGEALGHCGRRRAAARPSKQGGGHKPCAGTGSPAPQPRHFKQQPRAYPFGRLKGGLSLTLPRKAFGRDGQRPFAGKCARGSPLARAGNREAGSNG